MVSGNLIICKNKVTIGIQCQKYVGQYKKVGGTWKFEPVSQFGDFPSICIFR